MSVEGSDFFVDPELHDPIFAEYSPGKVSKDQHDNAEDDPDRSATISGTVSHQHKRPDRYDQSAENVDHHYERRCYEFLESNVFAHTDPSRIQILWLLNISFESAISLNDQCGRVKSHAPHTYCKTCLQASADCHTENRKPSPKTEV